MQKGRGLLLLAVLTLNFLCVFVTIPVQAVETAEWKDADLVWYYENLDYTDKKKIRQAIDYCIPRETIIEGLHHGYAVAIASPIGVNFRGIYEPSIQARKYNTSKAAELLVSVFGRIYDEDADGTNTTHTNVPYFKMTLVAPTTNTTMTQYASLIVYALNKVGIESALKFLSQDIIKPRIFLDPEGLGFGHVYEHGGYDMFFYSFDTSPDPSYKEYYDKNHFPPSANCYWIEDGAPTSGKWTSKAYPNVTALWTDIYAEPDPIERDPMLKEYQQWCYDQVPTSIIQQEMSVFGVDKELQGFDLFHGIKQNLANLTIGSQTSAVIAQPGAYVDLNPLLSKSYSDFLILDNIFCRLSRRRGEYNLSHPVPWLAESWAHSADYLVWDVTLRQGIFWEDGTEVTADDVIFSYRATMNESVGSPYRETLLKILENISAVEKTGIYGIRFSLPQFYPYVETVLFGIPPILHMEQMAQVPFAEWKTDETNTNRTPIGCGAYIFDSYPDNDTIILQVNPYYDETKMGHDSSMVGGGNWLPDPILTTVTFKVVKELILAVAGLKDGIYNLIDSQMDLQAQADYINASSWGKILLGYEWGYQEIGINHMNPIFGMNPKDPREMLYYPPLDPAKIKTLNSFFISFFCMPLCILLVVVGLQITHQMRTLTFTSWKGIILWYFLSGSTIFLLMYSDFPPNPGFVFGKASLDVFSLVLGGAIMSVIWAPNLLLLFLVLSAPAVMACPGPAPLEILGFDLWDLYVLSPFLIGPIISLVLSELILRVEHRRHNKVIYAMGVKILQIVRKK